MALVCICTQREGLFDRFAVIFLVLWNDRNVVFKFSYFNDYFGIDHYFINYNS